MEGLVGILGKPGLTNEWLADAWRALGVTAVVVTAGETDALGAGDVLLGRLDVLRSLDGIEPGLAALRRARRRGVRVVNDARSLVRTHDKLLTDALLGRAGIPRPRSEHVAAGRMPTLEPPVVVKPRYGSWGRDVERCDTASALRRRLRELRGTGWFERHGAVVQELVPLPAFDLRLIVAGGRLVGAVERVPARGEWRTNLSLGGSLRRPQRVDGAGELAIAAAAAVGGGLVGVDLLPVPTGGWVVLEVNGAVDFDRRYSLPGSDIYVAARDAPRAARHDAAESESANEPVESSHHRRTAKPPALSSASTPARRNLALISVSISSPAAKV